VGVPLGYHNHMNTISGHPDNLKLVMEYSDPKYVKLELDTAHSVAGGGDPAKQIEEYHDRLLFLHLKDVVNIPLDRPARSIRLSLLNWDADGSTCRRFAG
jgi:inosose dehydratase